MKAHLNRSWSQSMSKWLGDYRLDFEVGYAATVEVFKQSKDYINTQETCLRYPYFEAASHHAILTTRLQGILQMDTFRLLFHLQFSISYANSYQNKIK